MTRLEVSSARHCPCQVELWREAIFPSSSKHLRPLQRFLGSIAAVVRPLQRFPGPMLQL
jgi:hypothetical protein